MALPRLSSHKKLDGKDYPIAIFKFKYRSNGELQSHNLAQNLANAQARGSETAWNY